MKKIPALKSKLNPFHYNLNGTYHQKYKLVLNDHEITELITDTIANNPYIPLQDKKNICVYVKNGIVELYGTVYDHRSKPLAFADAFWCPSVVDVESYISVHC